MQRKAPPGRGPGPVAAAHRLLIVTALVGALFFGGWELREWDRTGARAAAVAAALAFTVAALIAVYYRSLRGLAAKLTPRRNGEDRR